MTGKIFLWFQKWVKAWIKPARLVLISGLLSDFSCSRSDLIAENALLRQQIIVLDRQIQRPQLTNQDRWIFVLLTRFTKFWKQSIHIVQPETFLRWHRELFHWHWRRKSQCQPKISPETIAFIRTMAKENPLWGGERIQGELLKLGIEVSKRTIQKYLPKEKRSSSSSQTWATFLKNQADGIWACDFIVVIDWLFRQWYIYIVMELKTRKIMHARVTKYPTDEWTAQQLREATPCGRWTEVFDPRWRQKICRSVFGSGNEFKYHRAKDAMSNTSSEWDLRTVHGEFAERMFGSYPDPS